MRQPFVFCFLMIIAITSIGEPRRHLPKAKPAHAPAAPPILDHSGTAKRGKASFYGKEFYGKKMADGTRMNPNAHVAASRTLPLGTKVEVKNLHNGKTALVVIRDRGPFVEGRIIDLSPKTADILGMRQQGVVPVEVRPLEVPQADGAVKRGVAASGQRSWLTSGE